MILSAIQYNPLQWGWSVFYLCFALCSISISSLSFLFGPLFSHMSRVWDNRDVKVIWKALTAGRNEPRLSTTEKCWESKRQGQRWKSCLQPRGHSSEEEWLIPLWVRSAWVSTFFSYFFQFMVSYLDRAFFLTFRSQFYFPVLPQIHHCLCGCSFSVNKRLLPVGFRVGLSGQETNVLPGFA